jgi:hypothetical protein
MSLQYLYFLDELSCDGKRAMKSSAWLDAAAFSRKVAGGNLDFIALDIRMIWQLRES